MSGEICTDNRFEIVTAYKKKLIEGTNIQASPEEMAVIDNILFRFWQMGWLPPIPHGDLIDRDAARGSIKPWSPEDERSACTFDTVKKLMHTMLDRAPTIIKAEEGEA